jgi:hypothetical protein
VDFPELAPVEPAPPRLNVESFARIAAIVARPH